MCAYVYACNSHIWSGSNDLAVMLISQQQDQHKKKLGCCVHDATLVFANLSNLRCSSPPKGTSLMELDFFPAVTGFRSGTDILQTRKTMAISMKAAIASSTVLAAKNKVRGARNTLVVKAVATPQTEHVTVKSKEVMDAARVRYRVCRHFVTGPLRIWFIHPRTGTAIATQAVLNVCIMVYTMQELMPGGVSSPVRAFNSVGGEPVVFDKVKGAYAWDVDGNQYIDYVGTWGPAICGHTRDEVVEALK